METLFGMRSFLIIIVCLFCSELSANLPPRPEPGLAVYITSNPTRTNLEKLVSQGDVLLHVLIPNGDQVQPLRREYFGDGFGGIIHFDHLSPASHLPYPDRFINTLYLEDPIANGEARRVLSTLGKVYQFKEGKWQNIQPLGVSPKLGKWTHRFYDATGNCLSDDPYAGLPEAIQWQHGPALEDGTADGKVPRIADGMFVATDSTTGDLVCRDAGNGMLKWQFPANLPNRNDFAVVAGKVYFHYKPRDPNENPSHQLSGKLAEVDLFTGQLSKVFEDSLEAGTAQPITFRRPDEGDRERKERPHPWFVVTDLYIAQAYGKELILLDRTSGKLLWRKSLEGDNTWFSPTLSNDLQILFAAECTIPARRGRHDGSHDAKAIHAWSLKEGKFLWKAEDIHPWRKVTEKGTDRRVKAEIKPLSYANGLLLVHISSYQFREGGQLAVLEANSGKKLWTHNFNAKELYTQGSQRAIIRNREVVLLDGLGAKRWDARTGAPIEEIYKHPNIKRLGRTNGACTASRATEKWLFCNATLFIDQDWKVNLRKGTRGACGQGLTPGYGLLYALPTPCDCGDYTRGYQAFSPRSALSDIQNEKRLVSTELGKTFQLAPVKEHPVGKLPWKCFLGNVQRTSSGDSHTLPKLPTILQWKTTLSQSLESVILEDRKMSERYLGELSAPVIGDGLVIVPVAEQHGIVALDLETGTKLWNFATGGKIDSPPSLERGVAIFGCDDGWVYALETGQGRLLWKFLAAPNHNKAMLHGHLGSSHPLIGSPLILGEQVIVAAGTHTDTGGLHLWNLDLQTGMPNHHRILDSGYFSPTTNGLLVADKEATGFWLGQYVHLDLSLQDIPNQGKITPEIWFDRNGDRIRFRTNHARGGSTRSWQGAVRSSWARTHRLTRVGNTVYAVKDPTEGDRHRVRANQTTLLSSISGTWQNKQTHWEVSNQSLGNHESYSSIIHAAHYLFLGGGSRDGKTGFFQIVDSKDGKLLHQEDQLPSRVTENGIAYSSSFLVLCCEDGTVIAFSTQPPRKPVSEDPCPECN